jgi:hypothetical protein
VADFTIFVHLRDANNDTRLTADHRPYDGYVPTTKWRPGAVIKDTSWIELPADMPPGEYTLYVGMYRVDTLERLPVQGDTSGENALQLGQITVLPAAQR